jgi:tetratricopeptide (TPR) repeat protein
MKTEISTVIQLASCYLNMKKYQDAESVLKKHVNNGTAPELYYYLGLSYSLQKKYDEAIDALAIHLNLNNESRAAQELIFQLLINKTQIAMEHADYSAVSDILAQAIKYSPKDEKSKKLLSHFESIMPVTYIRNGEREKAAKIWMEELKQSSFTNYETIHNLALLYYWWAISHEKDLQKENGVKDVKKIELSDYIWKKTIMYWLSFINSPAYWDKFCASRSVIWKTNISQDEVNNLKSEISKNKLLKVLEDFQESYRQTGSADDMKRIQSYINIYFFEKRTANYWLEFHELVSSNYESLPNELKQKADEILKLRGPFTLNFIKEHFAVDTPENVLSLIGNINRSENENELFDNISLFYNYPEYGKIAVVIREIKDIEYAFTLWEELSGKDNNKGRKLSKTTTEAQFLLALLLFEKGNHYLNIQEPVNALKDLNEAYSIIKNVLEKDKGKTCKILLTNLRNKTSQIYSDECVKYAKKLNVANKIDEAIDILEVGYKLTGNILIRNLLCGNYCEKAQPFLIAKNWPKANEFFNKALQLDRKYSGAMKGLATSKNNEGLAALNSGSTDKAITLLEEANDLENDKVVKENLATAYNTKAVKILNGLGSYSTSYSCEPALTLLKKGIKLLNSGLDVETISAGWASTEEYMFNMLVRDIQDGLYKTMLRNLWVGERARKNLRGY